MNPEKHCFFGKPPTLRPPKHQKMKKSRKTKNTVETMFDELEYSKNSIFVTLHLFFQVEEIFIFAKCIELELFEVVKMTCFSREHQTLDSCKISFRRDLSEPFWVVIGMTYSFDIRPSCIFYNPSKTLPVVRGLSSALPSCSSGFLVFFYPGRIVIGEYSFPGAFHELFS